MTIDSQPVATIEEKPSESSEMQQLRDQVYITLLTEQVATLSAHQGSNYWSQRRNRPHCFGCNTSRVFAQPNTACAFPVASLDILQETASIREMSRGHLYWAIGIPSSIRPIINLKDIMTVTVAVVKPYMVKEELGGVAIDFMLESGLAVSLMQCDVLLKIKNSSV